MSGKVSIIGGAGRVGSNAAYALQLGRSCSEIVLVDLNAEMAQGEALDLTHGRAGAGGPEDHRGRLCRDGGLGRGGRDGRAATTAGGVAAAVDRAQRGAVSRDH